MHGLQGVDMEIKSGTLPQVALLGRLCTVQLLSLTAFPIQFLLSSAAYEQMLYLFGATETKSRYKLISKRMENFL